jgi:citrate lyase beta subunit
LRRVITPTALGGTLFVPANHKNLKAILHRERFSDLRSVVVDFEDGLHVRDIQSSLSKFAELLKSYQRERLYLFVRPKDTDILQQLLHVKDISKIDGFVLAKFSLKNMQSYLDILKPHDFYIMPSIEGEELFDINRLRVLKERLQSYKSKILLIRFGGEDMLRQLGLKRTKEISLYDMIAPSHAIANILHVFKTSSYSISAPVFPFFDDLDSYKEELRRDLIEGFISKTIIHPSQIEPLESIYRVSESDFKLAKKILHVNEAVFANDGAMAEVTTQSAWAEGILERADVYGILPI